MTVAEAHAAAALPAGTRIARRDRNGWTVATVERTTATTTVADRGRISRAKMHGWVIVDETITAQIVAEHRRRCVERADLRRVDALTDEQVDAVFVALRRAGLIP